MNFGICKDPKPTEAWTDVRDATSHGKNCAQLDFLTNQIIGGDDCLYLNVYTKNINANAHLPVIVWIHGVAFVAGSGDDSYYGADYFMSKNVVVVTINYRFGVLGKHYFILTINIIILFVNFTVGLYETLENNSVIL